MRVIIAGARDFTDYARGVAHIESAPFEITGVLCGMARGFDRIGYAWAKSKNIPIEEYPAEWDRYGPSAGPRRNEQMARAYPGGLVLVWFGDSSGSANMLHLAKIRYSLWIHELRIPRIR